ncbi:MAG: LUD domain-containing protein [Thermodesulfovibrionales bacterium]|nr:LUD domain-containing protein [Thermodesulfovibrionales bacterium]
MKSKEFKYSIDEALKNANITGALSRFSEAYVVSRAKAFEGIDFEELRSKIAQIKSYVAENLNILAVEFKKNAEAKGAKVVRLNSPELVRQYILNLAKEKGVRSIVKSKSMASEEIHLNPYLGEAGLEVRETDLGEWIIQLAGQKPSHMVLPAIHLKKEEVAEIFSKEVNERLSSDIPRLVKVARQQLRDKFLEADMGISGANIAVAETGSIVIIENEGNARLVTSLPKIHVALVGLEKLVSNFTDISPILTALPKSATGQMFTSYVSIISGQTPNIDGSMKDLHIILMDNKRSEMANDPIFKEALQCIRCASCLNVCPVFRLVGGHVFGKVYTGGIGTILTAWFDELQKSEEIQGLCIQCGRCKEVCPGKIDIPELIVEIRRRLNREKGQSFVQKTIFSVVNNRKLFHSILRKASIFQKPFIQEGFIRHLPMFLNELADFRSLPAIAEVPFRDRFNNINQPKSNKKVIFYAGCLIDFAYPEMAEDVIKIFNKANFQVIFPQEQTCCGAPARYSGVFDVAVNNAIDNIKALLKEDADYIVSACPTCTAALKYEFISTLKSQGADEWLLLAKRVAEKSYDLSSLVKMLCDSKQLALKVISELQRVTYHDACHLKRTLRVFSEPRELLKRLGLEIIEMFESDVCCGMGGSYSLKFPEVSKPILQRKLKNIKDTAVDTVIMDCPGCVMQIKGGFDKEGSTIAVKHIAEIIAKQL